MPSISGSLGSERPPAPTISVVAVTVARRRPEIRTCQRCGVVVPGGVLDGGVEAEPVERRRTARRPARGRPGSRLRGERRSTSPGWARTRTSRAGSGRRRPRRGRCCRARCRRRRAPFSTTRKSVSPSSSSLIAAHEAGEAGADDEVLDVRRGRAEAHGADGTGVIEQVSIRVRDRDARHDPRTRLSPDAAPRAAARPRRAPARHPVARRAVDRPARRGGRHLARAALPLLRQQARLPRGRRPPGGRRPDRADRAARRGRAAGAAAGLGDGVRRLRRSPTTRATSRWCKGAAGGNEALREIYEEARAALDRPDLPRGRRRATIVPDTPAARLMVRGWSAMTEELVLSWVAEPARRHPRGAARDPRGRAARPWSRSRP